MQRESLLGAAAALILVAAGYGAPARADERGDLAAARMRWESSGLASYEYGYQKYCECHPDAPPETIVTVRGGSVQRVRHRMPATGDEVEAPRNLDSYWTIEGLFELLDRALARAAEVRVSYDAASGYPRTIYIDYDPELIGDELDLRLTSVTPL